MKNSQTSSVRCPLGAILRILSVCLLAVSGATLSTAASPLAGICYQSGSGFRYFDKSTGLDTLIIQTTNSIFEKAVSPANTKLALTYRLGGTVYVSIVNFRPFKINVVANSSNSTMVALAWKDDKTLGFNFLTTKKEGDKYQFQNMGSYYVNTDSLKANYLKFNNGSTIVAWLPSGLLVTRYDKQYYIINTVSGKPTATFSDVDKVTFSPDGKRCFYYQGMKVIDENGREISIPELYVADFDGKNAKKVVTYMDMPKNATWSPDGHMIALDVKARKWADVRFLAFCEAKTGKTLVEQNDEVSRVQPMYSKNAARMFYYETETTTYNGVTAMHGVVRLDQDQTRVNISEGSRGDAQNSVGTALEWYDDVRIGLAVNGGVYIVNADTRERVFVPGTLVYCWEGI